MDLLRFATAGSVDDGKSTLIGRLLLDSKSIFEDQLEAVEATSHSRGYDYTDLALLTDGLRSEREQGITIDVAYRYFATPARKFIIADTPGHVQYTRNMVTGASTADLGLVLVDARQGLTEQSRRHAVLLSLLRVPHLVLAINKMDLVDWSKETYDRIHDEFTQFATKLSIPDLAVVPISALKGDNVVIRSENTPWYDGPTLMHHLEHVHVASDRDLVDTRFPVQYVVRPKSDQHHDYRGYAGQVAGGVLKPGDEVVILPSGMTSTIQGIDLFDKEIDEAFPPMSVTVRLSDDVDVSRGDMIARVKNAPKPSQDIDAMICWMTNEPLRPRQKLAIKHTTRMGRAMVKDIQYRLDVNTLHRDQDTKELALNDIGRVHLRTTVPLLCDPYSKNRTTGSFILIDEATGVTVGAGMINSRQLNDGHATAPHVAAREAASSVWPEALSWPLISQVVVLSAIAYNQPSLAWAAIAVGRSIGNVAAIAGAYGWNLSGPARWALSPAESRDSLYFDSLRSRVLVCAFVLAGRPRRRLGHRAVRGGHPPAGQLLSQPRRSLCLRTGSTSPRATHLPCSGTTSYPDRSAALSAAALVLAGLPALTFPVLLLSPDRPTRSCLLGPGAPPPGPS